MSEFSCACKARESSDGSLGSHDSGALARDGSDLSGEYIASGFAFSGTSYECSHESVSESLGLVEAASEFDGAFVLAESVLARHFSKDGASAQALPAASAYGLLGHAFGFACDQEFFGVGSDALGGLGAMSADVGSSLGSYSGGFGAAGCVFGAGSGRVEDGTRCRSCDGFSRAFYPLHAMSHDASFSSGSFQSPCDRAGYGSLAVLGVANPDDFHGGGVHDVVFESSGSFSAAESTFSVTVGESLAFLAHDFGVTFGGDDGVSYTASVLGFSDSDTFDLSGSYAASLV